jgi:glutathione S-transferase
MSLILYDLAGADPARRFSPYCWRVRLAIEHKGLSVETIPWRFTDKDVIAFSGQERVPLLIDSGKTVVGSWAIADHLEQTYQERPSLFSRPGGKVFSRYMEFWSDSVLMPGLMPLIILDLFNHLHYKDRVYFRSSREQKLGMSLERAGAHRESRLGEFQRSLELLRNTLRKQPFLDGDEPNYADYIVFSGFMWARCVSPFKVLQDEDPVALWRRRLLERFDVARNSPGYDT